MTHRIEQLRLDAPFAAALQTFLNDVLTADWAQRIPSFLFFRDFEDLPTRAPFDVDALCAHEDWPHLIEMLEPLAARHGLLLAKRSSEVSMHILVLDIAGDPSKRRHCFFEIQAALKIPASQFAVRPDTNAITIAPNDVPRATDWRFPVPEPRWRCLFIILQALRKADAGKYLERLSVFDDVDRDAAITLASGRYGFALDGLKRWLAAPTPSPAAKAASAPVATGWRDRLAPFCADYLFFLPLLRLDFFTIHGPDGVGKSTTCAEVARIFEGLPVGLYQFHHSAGWKEGSRQGAEGTRTEPPIRQAGANEHVSTARQIARTIYRWLPPPLKELWLWNSHFVNYNRKFTRFLYDNRNAGRILFADRYIYDVKIKYIVETLRPSWLVRGYYRFHCALVPKPRFGFVLIDAPAAIVARKDELTETQVTQFIDRIGRMLQLRRVPHLVIPVAGRPPRDIACEIANGLLARRGSDLIADMRTFVSRLEASDTNTPQQPAPDAPVLRETV